MSATHAAGEPPSALLAPLERALPSLRGRAGLVLADADGRELLTRDPDALYPAASVIKLPIVMTLYADAAAGRISLDERLPLGEPVEGSGVLRHLADVGELTIRDHAALMIMVSDNTSTNRLIERLGIAHVNERLEEWGCHATRLGALLFDREAVAHGVRNVMTPRETAALLLRLVRGELVDRATSDAVLGILTHASGGGLRRYLPFDAYVAHKPGTIRGVRNDAGVLRVDRQVVAVGFTADLADEAEGDLVLGLLGWAAYRRAGGGERDEPPSLGTVR